MNCTEIVAKEQILVSLMKMANAKISSANELKETMKNDNDIKELETKITTFRTNVMSKIQNAMVSLETEKLSQGGISEDDWTLI